ncbi:MAG TPA: hypothetical protein VE219_02690, partial [Candidatus Sulfotelmatobacter sp.]|nr:hypothetical protein [Candidatus Sulfotelmatobacter sp.]
AVLAATAALLAVSLVTPHPASALGALAGALGAGLTVTAYSVLVRLWGHALVEPQPAVLAAAGGCAAAACALALVGGHG